MKKEIIKLILEPVSFGNKVTLETNIKGNFETWSIEDSFNGRSEESKFNEPVYGFFSPHQPVNVIFFDHNKKEEIYNNIKITMIGGAKE